MTGIRVTSLVSRAVLREKVFRAFNVSQKKYAYEKRKYLHSDKKTPLKRFRDLGA
jgi:hypothetical protein